VSRLPIRVRLTATFAVAMLVVLAGAGLFVYLRLKSDLDESVTAGLHTRADAVLASGSAAAGAPGEGEEGFAQLLRPDGSVVGLSGGIRGAALDRAELRRAAGGEQILVERRLSGIVGKARVLARGAGGEVVAVGQSLQDRDDTLANLAASFAIGGPVAVLLASLLGYALASAGLRPVEAMRQQAEQVSLAGAGDSLPLPAAHDEIRRRDAQRDARPPAALLRARAELRGRREPRAAHAGGGDQDRGGGSAARGRTRPAGA
jgi:two-component system OmpR family sensor kinase